MINTKPKTSSSEKITQNHIRKQIYHPQRNKNKLNDCKIKLNSRNLCIFSFYLYKDCHEMKLIQDGTVHISLVR